MKVTVINYTLEARELLLFSKKTRLKMTPADYDNIRDMSNEEKQKELDYVFGTIGSSLEFVDYTILIEGVTRAFTHQLVRHRVGVSFAQQSQRTVDMAKFEFVATGEAQTHPAYQDAMDYISDCYSDMIEDGVSPQDARGILPTNICTNILMKINLRALSSLLNIRLCYKAQGEFQDVAREIRREVMRIHPWAEPVLQVQCVQHLNCAFPNFTECPIKTHEALIPSGEGEHLLRNEIKRLWELTHFEVKPGGTHHES